MISGMFSALSGLDSLTKKVDSTANNVANANTPGFKSSRVTLKEGGTQPISTAAGAANVGRGATVGSVDSNFSQGSFETSANPTDMAIGGQGFFMLRNPESTEADKFSRAGGFRFDQEGALINPDGYYVQGWQIDPTSGERHGSIGDIDLGKSTPPEATRQVGMVVNLDSRAPNESTNVQLFDAWDGRNAATANPNPPIGAANYDYSSAVKIYDSQGTSHEVTVYFDRTPAENQWEFLVTTDPLNDQRVSDPSLDRYNATDDKGAGALMYGVIDFSSSGDIRAITAYEVPPDGNVAPETAANRIDLEVSDLYHSFQLNATGDTSNQEIELNLGARFSGQNTDFEPEAMASTQYANSSSTIFQTQDGNGAGFLQSVAVGTDGVISGHYSNGQVLQRAQVALANFNNPGGLVMAGGNLYSASSESGAPLTGAPGTVGLGNIAPNALEQSNVELSRELPNLMLTKRYFQANLKIIQTEDEMLGNILDIKK